MARSGKVVVLVFHGIGTYVDKFDDPETRFDRPLWDGLYRRLGEALKTDVVWAPVLWSLPELENYQNELTQSRKDWGPLFNFVTSALADACAYRLPQDERNYKNSNYYKVQQRVFAALKAAEEQVVAEGHDPKETPILAVCQSMGCHVLSSYAWDARQKPDRIFSEDDPARNSAFATLESLASIVFTGCNLPLLTAGVKPGTKVPIAIRRDTDRWGTGQRWLNFYDPDDVLGYPLGKEYAAYWDKTHPDQDRLKNEYGRDPDKEIRVKDDRFEMRTALGLPNPVGLTPLVHNEYWRSSEVISAIANAIRDLR